MSNNVHQRAELDYISSYEMYSQNLPVGGCQTSASTPYFQPLQYSVQSTNHTQPTAYTESQIYDHVTTHGPEYNPAFGAQASFHSEWPSGPYPAWQSHASAYPPWIDNSSTYTSEQGLYTNFETTRSSRSLSESSILGQHAQSSGYSTPSNGRSLAPSSATLLSYGIPMSDGTWHCAYPGCTSKAIFTRGCDLRKHYKRHTKTFFCQHVGCAQATGGGFSSGKDLARHEARHNPDIPCEWEGCDRVFSRVDNMRDHVKRIHWKAARML